MIKQNISVVPKADCTGCHACVAVCPKACIRMEADGMGFPYPVVDALSCIQCGVCYTACTSNSEQVNKDGPRHIYAVRNKDEGQLKRSASGAVFPALVNVVLESGGVIVGSAFQSGCKSVCHTIAEDKGQTESMRGSKYTYSACPASVFKQVQSYLSLNRAVLFTGTPCQIAALKSFLKRPDDNLYTVDILCHGVESPKVFEDYIAKMSRRGEVSYVNFRTKKHDNWHECKTTVYYKNGLSKSGFRESAYFNMFVSNLGLRPSCYHCKFCRFERCGDVTLGDFWGIEKTSIRSFDSPEGCSVVTLNTDQGIFLFNKARHELFSVEATRKDCSHEQLNGLPAQEDRSFFVEEYLSNGYSYVERKYGLPDTRTRILEKAYSCHWIWKLRNLLKSKFA